MLKRLLIFTLFMTMLLFGAEEDPLKQEEKIFIGHRFSLFSQVLGEKRPIWVYLPTGYAHSDLSYPVFYLLDGDIHFHHVSGIVEVLSKFSHMPPMILIALPNVDRERDFLPTRVENWPQKAESEKFRAFIKTELIPLVEKKFRVRPYRILCGHSFGGLFCLETFLKDPDLFTGFITISGTLNWDNQLLLRLAEKKLKTFIFDRKFLFISLSADDQASIVSVQAFVKLLEKNSPEGLLWKFEYREKDDHLSVVHPTIYEALRWLHQGWRLSETDAAKMSLREIIDYYEKISRRYGSNVLIPEGVLFNRGYAFMDSGKKSETVEVFEYAIKMYPDSPASYIGLGEFYESIGNLEQARKYLESGYKLAKKNNDRMVLPSAKAMLEMVLKKIKKKSDQQASE